MIKNFETYINEDYFSKLANRKDTGDVRKENEITEDDVLSFFDNDFAKKPKSITIRKDGNKTIVDVDGNFYMKKGVSKIPFKFGTVTGNFRCANEISSLDSCPLIVGGMFVCSHCKKLKSLEGCPQEVGDDLDFRFCRSLMSLNGLPKKVGGNILCANCGRQFKIEEIKSVCNVKGKMFL